MSTNKQKQPEIETFPITRGPLVETLESAVERGTLSANLLRELAQKFGLKATKKAVAACVRDLENLRDDVEQQLKAIDKHAGVVGLKHFADEFFRMAVLESNVGFNQADAKRKWPWLAQKVPLPCTCKRLITPNAVLVLQHLYDTHVVDRRDWKPGRLENWARTKASETGSRLPA